MRVSVSPAIRIRRVVGQRSSDTGAPLLLVTLNASLFAGGGSLTAPTVIAVVPLAVLAPPCPCSLIVDGGRQRVGAGVVRRCPCS